MRETKVEPKCEGLAPFHCGNPSCPAHQPGRLRRMRETKVEKQFTRRVKGLGGWAVKILPSVSGLPDRMAIMPGGRVIFVELKAPKKTAAPHQTVVHAKLATLGCPVAVLDTLEAVDAWADEQALL